MFWVHLIPCNLTQVEVQWPNLLELALKNHSCTIKNAFQSKAYLPLADRILNAYNWPCNYLDMIYDLDLDSTRFDKWNQIKFQVAKLTLSNYDPHLDPVNLMLKLDLDMVKMYHHTKNGSTCTTNCFKSYSLNTHTLYTHTDGQTHRHYENITYPHTREVIIHSA